MNEDSEFNTPGEMVARAMFLLTHAALAAGIILTAAGVLAWQFTLTLAGVAALGASWIGRTWLRSREAASESRALEAIIASSPPLDDERVADLIRLLEQWEELEQKRGSPEFDPWAIQAVRHDIREVVESDPALEQLFSRLRDAA